MAASPEFSGQRLRRRLSGRVLRLRLATLAMLIAIAVGAGIAIAWFARVERVEQVFGALAQIQGMPPGWLQVPAQASGRLLLLSAALLVAIAIAITRLPLLPRRLARPAIVGILLVLTMRYLLWRSLTTLNLETPLNGTLSLLLLAAEMLGLASGSLQLFLLFNVPDRSSQANRLQDAVASGEFRPTVDILIPTYNEPDFILRRTIIGCQAIDYEPKQVYLLDDTRRPEIRALAAELGCEYVTRPDNQHAKAGNLNHALPLTQGDLIAVFDADFVPTRNFLARTVGFFQGDRVGLVQTPQSFYNPDPIAYNLGLEDILTPEEEVFYRQIQPIKDGAGSVVCSGTAFVVRRSAIEAAGGFFTESLSEDYFTGIRLSAQGYRLVYLDEKLSAGLAAENIAAHITQRLRWARGTLQAFFIEANPLTIPGLNLRQRLAHFEGLLQWFTSFSRIIFLLMPLAYSFLGVVPLRTTPQELLYFFLPLYLVQLAVFTWLNCNSRSALLSDIYAIVAAFPLAIAVFQVMLRPFSRGFKVTPKGTQSDRARFNWTLGMPIILLFVLTATSLWVNVGRSMLAMHDPFATPGLSLGWLWSIYNLTTLGVTLLVLLDLPQPDVFQWYGLRRIARLDLGDREVWGFTTRISEVGLELTVNKAGNYARDLVERQAAVRVVLVEENLQVRGTFSKVDLGGDVPRLQIKFAALTLEQQRQLVQLLYCRPGQWLSRKSPGELQSLVLLFRILLRPYFLIAARRRGEKAIAVAQI